MEINWNLLSQAQDPGQAFMQGMETGRQRREQEARQNALTSYARNPQDEGALNALAPYDPQFVIQQRQHQAQQQQQGIEAHRENIIRGAQIIRQIQPKDEAGWQQALAMAAQVGIPTNELPQNFDPSYVSGVVSLADTFAPNKQNEGTAMQQNYEFLKSRGGSYADDYLKRQTSEPPMIASNGDGTFTIIPRSNIRDGGEQGGPAVGSVEDGYRFKGGNPADQNNWEAVGGPSPSGSATFP